MAGPLIVASGGRLELCAVSTVSGIAVLAPNIDALPVEGGYGAIVLCGNFARDAALLGMPCGTAAKCLHTMASRMAEAVDGAGGRDKYGIDIAVLAAAGAATRPPRRTDRTGAPGIHFDEMPGGTGPLPGREGGV